MKRSKLLAAVLMMLLVLQCMSIITPAAETSPASTASTVKAAKDTTPPEWTWTDVSYDYKTVTLYFNERIYNNTGSDKALKAAVTLATDGSKFAALKSGDKVTIDGYNLVINFAAPLIGSKNKVRVAGKTIKDVASNVRKAVTTTPYLEGAPAHKTPPEWVSTDVYDDFKLVSLSFDEDIYNNTKNDKTLKAAITLATNGTNFAALKPGDSVWISWNAIYIQFANPLSGSKNKIRMAGKTIRDVSGNVRNAVTTTPYLKGGPEDKVPPEWVNTEVSNGNKTVTLTFNEAIFNNTGSAKALKAAVTLATNGSSFAALKSGDSVTISGDSIVIKFAKALSGSKNKVRVAGKTIKDNSGNVRKAVTTTPYLKVK